MNAATLPTGSLLIFTTIQDNYRSERQFDELGQTTRVTSKLVGKTEINTLYTVVSARNLKYSTKVTAMDATGNKVKLSINGANASKWSVCEPIPA